MDICEYINLTYLPMNMHANMHKYVCCLLQLTYMHMCVYICMYIYICIHIHMNVVATEKKLTRNQFDWIYQAKR